MTTPNQPLPTTVETLLGQGAYQIGGGGTGFGQGVNPDDINGMFTVPYASFDNMLNVLAQALNLLPFDAVQAFKGIVPTWVDAADTPTGVQRIVEGLNLIYSDNFDRAEIGGADQWSLTSDTADEFVIFLNRLSYLNTATGAQSGICIGQTAGDGSKVEANLIFNVFSNSQLGVMLHCNRDFSQVVYLGIGGGTADIYSGPITSLTSRASVVQLSVDGLYGLYYDVANDKYVALKDGAAISTGLEWASPSVSNGPDFRYGGARIECAASANAGQIDNWNMRDWTPPV